jgi:D-glycero-alpha-D-manno-heptose-7-phosphate kinase
VLIRAKAPFRIEFVGGGTDVPPFTDMFGGYVFNATIDRYAFCSISPRTDGEFKIVSMDYNITKRYQQEELIFDGTLDLVKAVIKRMSDYDQFHLGGFNMVLYSDVPAGSGLGSSSTVCVAMVGALAEYYRIPLTTSKIARLAYEIERLDLGIAGGLQDQYAAAYGGFNLMEFGPDLAVTVNPMRISQAITNELLYHFLLIDTGKNRLSDNILTNQIGLLETNPDDVVPHYLRLKELAVEMKNTLITGDVADVAKLADLMEAAYQTKKNVTPYYSNERVETIYQTAKAHGALGGIILGAGGGGHMLFYVPIVKRRAVIQALGELGAQVVPFNFEDQGLQTWVVND